MYDYRAQVDRVIDGDTVEMSIDLGFDVWYRDPVRLKDVDAPEITGMSREAGIKAKIYLTELLSKGPVIIHTEYKKSKDKYGRVLGTLFVNGVNINQKMIDDGYAIPYMK